MKIEEEKTLRLGHTTYERLRNMIFNGSLSAGEALQEKKLAQRLGVSRTPIREAVTRLTTEGLVQRSAGSTPVVRRLSTGDFIEILHVRRLLEVEAAGLAAQSNLASHHNGVGEKDRSDELRAIRARIATFKTGSVPSAEEHIDADDALHSCVAGLAGSRILADLIHDLRQKTKIFDMGRVPERFEPGIGEHLEIIDAILARDTARAQAAMRTHIDNVRTSVINHLGRLF